jgi:2-polyprenyl-3-methyl-5-hydroxy-6-metoxy-1,4-benzoquinol methylase
MILVPNVKSTNYQKIVKKFFSTRQSISYYSKPRLHLSEKKLFKKYLIKKGKVLDLCCGAGRVSIPLAKMGFEVIGIDNNSKMIRIARDLKKELNLKNVKFYCSDIAKRMFRNEQFDYVLIMENSLEHIPSKKKRKKVFKNICNYLKHDGLFITSFHSCFYPPIFAKLFICNVAHTLNFLFSKSHHLSFNDVILDIKIAKRGESHKNFYHFFSPFEINRIAREAGLEIIEVIPINILDRRKNKIKNLKVYQHLKFFLYCYWIMTKQKGSRF